MSKKTLFLAWQDKTQSRAWFPVGRLDANVSLPKYTFRYIHGAKRAKDESGFAPPSDFPDFERPYTSDRLFPLFQNRVMDKQSCDFRDYLEILGIKKQDPDPLEMLEIDGGYSDLDSFHVFPKIEKKKGGDFHCRFFLHGWRHANDEARKRIDRLQAGENLQVAIELNSPTTDFAVQIQTKDYCMIGWAPRYLARDLAKSPDRSPGDCHAHVVKLNPVSASPQRRVLIDLNGHWPPGHEPMVSKDFQPIVPAAA